MTKVTTSNNLTNKNEMVITSISDFEAIVDEFETSCEVIRNIIELEKNNCNRLNGTDVWKGKAGEAIYSKYNQLNSNYDQIDYSLQIYTGFLRKTAEDYKMLLEEQNKNIDAMSTNLDVNS